MNQATDLARTEGLWGRVFSPQSEEEKLFAKEFFEKTDPIEYLNGLFLDAEISRYKVDARRHLVSAVASFDEGLIVDLGCGSGLDLQLLAKEVLSHTKLVGVDPSPLFVESTRNMCRDLSVSVIVWRKSSCC
jgi:SAM-dependent methyltransferase